MTGNHSGFQLTQPDDFTRALASYVRCFRQRNQWTQQVLAARAGIPASTLSRFERTGLAASDAVAKLLFALGALDDFHSFLAKRRSVLEIPQDLRELKPAKEIRRVRIKKGDLR